MGRTGSRNRLYQEIFIFTYKLSGCLRLSITDQTQILTRKDCSRVN